MKAPHHEFLRPATGATALHAGHSAASLYELVVVQAQRDADAVAILAPGRSPLGFGQLLDQINRIRTTLNGCGLGRNDRIALLAERGPETAVAALGIASCAVCVPLNAAATPTELEDGLVQTGAKALLIPATTTVAVKSLASRVGILSLEYFVEEDASAGSFCFHETSAAVAAQGGPATAEEIAFILQTSGTTTRAKIVPVTHGNVFARTDKLRRMLGLSPADCCLNLMPLCYSYGLTVGLIAPLAAGCAIISPPVFDIETALACMREFSPIWCVANATYYHAILERLEKQPSLLAGHRLRFAVSGGSPLPARVRANLEKVLGALVLEYYATTETGAIAAEPLVGTRKQGTVGISPDNDVAIMDADGNLVAPGVHGEVVICGPTVFGGYENDPVANQRVLRRGWYHTGDLGMMDAGGYIKLAGRLDEVINRGGEKIAPLEVDEALLSHEAVAEAVSFPVPHPTLHEEIAAAVVPHSGAQVTGNELQCFLATRLAPFKVPRVILCTAGLPKGPTGKLYRAGLATHFGLNLIEVAPSVQVEPRTKIQEMLLDLWRDVLKRPDIGCNDDFFLCGGDSVTAFDLMLRIEKEFQYTAPLTILAEAPTVSRLASRLETMTLGAVSNMIRIHPEGRRRPLFAVYHAGTHALALLPILRSLGPDQPCYWLQPPGMDWTGTECATVPQIAAYYIKEVKAVQPRGPYRLLGNSFGGHVVFEMALQLQEAGESIEFLAILDTEAPTCAFGDKVDVFDSRGLRLRTLNAQPAPVSRFEAVTRSILETHIRMARDYVLDSQSDRNIFRGELTYFHCTGEPIVAGHDRRGMWRSFVSGFRLLLVPGPYGTPDREPQYAVLRNLLRACLNDAPVTGCDPARVYDRDYRLDNVYQPKYILGSMGDVYRIDQERIQGFVDDIRINAEAILIKGWAVEPCRRQPAQIIAVFLDDQFLGYGASGESRPDVAKHLDTASVLFSGFYFRFEGAVAANAMRRPRVFVLSSDGWAAELRGTIEPVTIGLTRKLSNTEHADVILGGNWSYREQWGVWSSGHQATVIFDASCLPHRFTVAIQANLFPPAASPTQTVRVSDESGNLLTIISNEQPSGEFTAKMEKSLTQLGPWAGDAPFFVEVGEAGVAVVDAMRHQRCVQLVA
jgi:acyl-CoA synthetase (AMP-forming)/AMP-acid ligase II/acyl carrier protein